MLGSINRKNDALHGAMLWDFENDVGGELKCGTPIAYTILYKTSIHNMSKKYEKTIKKTWKIDFVSD